MILEEVSASALCQADPHFLAMIDRRFSGSMAPAYLRMNGLPTDQIIIKVNA